MKKKWLKFMQKSGKRVATSLICASIIVAMFEVHNKSLAEGTEQTIDKTVSISLANASKINDTDGDGYGEFEGWGTSLCWWGSAIGYSDSLTEDAVKYFYNADEGLGLNIIRFNIGGGDNPTMNTIVRSDRNMQGYWKSNAYGDGVDYQYDETTKNYTWEFDASKDQNQAKVLFAVNNYFNTLGEDNNLIVQTFSNSPPYFMTNTDSSTGPYVSNQKANSLETDAYDDFARYLVQVTKYLQDNGVKIESIEPVNESGLSSHWHFGSTKQEGSHFNVAAQNKIIQTLYQEIENQGLNDVEISASDEVSVKNAISLFKQLNQNTKNCMTRIQTHTYGNTKLNELYELALNSGKKLWMSEVDGSWTAGENAGNMAPGLGFANRLLGDMNSMKPCGWVMWQAIGGGCHTNLDMNDPKQNTLNKIDNESTYPDYSTWDDADPFWGIAVADHSTEKIIRTMKYYSYGQFTRYIRPGYTIIGDGSKTLAAYDKINHQLVVVAINDKAENLNYRFDLSDFELSNSTVKPIRTSGSLESGEKWAELDSYSADETGFNAVLKGNSITTYIISGVMGEKSVSPESENIDLSDKITAENCASEHSVENLIDDSTETYCEVPATNDSENLPCIVIDLGVQKKLMNIQYAPKSDDATLCSGVKILGSNDNAVWTTLHTIDDTEVRDADSLIQISLENAVYQYLKFESPDESTPLAFSVIKVSEEANNISINSGKAYKLGSEEEIEYATEGTVICVKADDLTGQDFLNWTVNKGNVSLSSVTDREITFTMGNQAVNLSANYEPHQYTLTVENGSATDDTYVKLNSAIAGTVVYLKANTPADGQEFDHWEVLEGGAEINDVNAASTSFNMPNANVSLKAVYKDQSDAGLSKINIDSTKVTYGYRAEAANKNGVHVEYLFDGNYDTNLQLYSETSGVYDTGKAFIQIDLGSPQKVKQLQVAPIKGKASTDKLVVFANIAILGSNDNTNWDTLAVTGTGLNLTQKTMTPIELSGDNEYQYIKIYKIGAKKGDAMLGLSEIAVYVD